MILKKNHSIYQNILNHETKRHALYKFLLVLLVFCTYFIFIAEKYGVQQGLFVSVLTWSFFVLCTPIADAGLLIDFPLRLITHVRMFVLEIFVWIIAISLNFYAYSFTPDIYIKTKILTLFEHILAQPLPFWSIIIISMVGTFVSIGFADELIDKVSHEERSLYHKYKYKHRFIMMAALFLITFILYDFLLKQLGINVPI